MQFKNILKRISLITAATVIMSYAVIANAPANASYSFKVHNTGKNKIIKLSASEDGQKYVILTSATASFPMKQQQSSGINQPTKQTVIGY
ncbi:MAG: hypothetical protein ACR2GD_06410 [Pyrinomonadaceae bacterium]